MTYRLEDLRKNNLNLRTHLKLDYNIKSLNYIQKKMSSLVPTLLNYVLFFGLNQWFKSY